MTYRKQLIAASTATLAFAAAAAAQHTVFDLTQKIDPDNPPVVKDELAVQNPIPLIMAGDPNGEPPDSPANRVDPNVVSSPYAGVASISPAGSLCSAVPISREHVLSAGHCFDFNSNGTNDVGTNVDIVFNTTGNQSFFVNGPSQVDAVNLHPDFTGFANPSVNDDLALITLSSPLPSNIPIYPVYTGSVSNGQEFTSVGYGQSGNGVSGAFIGSSFFIKRVGSNRAEQFSGNDDPGGGIEVFQFDFDAPSGFNCFGSGSMGNDIETTFGGGDSGGPSFVMQNGRLHTYGINTFGGGCIQSTPLFGSSAGGMLVNGYLNWFADFVPPSPFSLEAPEDGSEGVSTTPTLDWANTDFVSTFNVTIATDDNLNNVVFEQSGLTDTSFTVPEGELAGATEYFWHVEAVNDNGSTSSDPFVFSFTTVTNGDLTGDGDIDGGDLGVLLGQWGDCPDEGSCSADLNGDDVVDGADLGILLGAWTGSS